MLSDRQLGRDHDPFPIEMTVEEQFKAAVQIIQGLPKDGPFQVSHTMALKVNIMTVRMLGMSFQIDLPLSTTGCTSRPHWARATSQSRLSGR